MKVVLEHWPRVLGALLALVVVYGLVTYGMPVVGRVVDADNGAPVGNAYVAVAWNANLVGFGETSSECPHETVAKTSSQGWFFTWPWLRLRSVRELGPFVGLHAGRVNNQVMIYKTGYSIGLYANGSTWGRRYTIRPFSGTPAEHLEMLKRGVVNCDDASFSSTLPIHEAMREEIRAIPGADSFMVGRINIIEEFTERICNLSSTGSPGGRC